MSGDKKRSKDDSCLSDKERVTLNVLIDQINHCRSDITAYNSQFLASSVLCAIVAAFAVIAQTKNLKSEILNLFYVLPSVYFFSLYNVIKYTAEQLRIGAYRQVLEDEAGKYIIGDFLCWEKIIPQGDKYVITGGVVQIFFDVPISMCILVGFWQLPHDVFWWIICFFIIIEIIVILYMAGTLFNMKAKTVSLLKNHLDLSKLTIR